MTIKEYIKRHFENYVEWNAKYDMWDDESFYRVWDRLEKDIDLGGIQWALEWYMDEPTLTPARSKYISTAIDNYIKKNIRPIYVNY